ncbi:origin recognition complex subunit 2-domain-containing protein, partial [Phakopsora pachyrhizi]
MPQSTPRLSRSVSRAGPRSTGPTASSAKQREKENMLVETLETPSKKTLNSKTFENQDESERPTMNRVKFNVDEDDDGDEDNLGIGSSDGEEDLLNRLGLDPEDRLGQGFLKAENSSDAYFLAHGKYNQTSGNLFSARSTWKGPMDVLDYILEPSGSKSLKSFKDNWEQWAAELNQGYSLLFYGIGSKRETINEFAEHGLVDGMGWEGLIVNGFQANFHLSSMISDLEEMIYGTANQGEEGNQTTKKLTSFDALESRAKRLCEYEKHGQPQCVLVVHNLDGPALRNSRTQTIISMLAAKPQISLLATIDHIHAPILLPPHLSSARPPNIIASKIPRVLPLGFNFLYHHMSTQVPYTVESLLSGAISSVLPPNIFPPTVLNRQSSKSDIRQNGPTTSTATLHVLSSVTEKAKALFRLMAEHQINLYSNLSVDGRTEIDEILKIGILPDESPTPIIAICGRKLFELARSEFITSVESQMQALLLEFRDHNIVL